MNAYDITIETGPNNRLVVCTRDDDAGFRFVSIAPQYRDRAGAWRPSGSGLLLRPNVARHLAPAILAIANGPDKRPADSGARAKRIATARAQIAAGMNITDAHCFVIGDDEWAEAIGPEATNDRIS